MTPLRTSSAILAGLAVLLGAAGPSSAADKEKLFVATPLTAEKSFTAGVEGPACDAQGNVYAVNFRKQQTIGKITPDGQGEIWLELPGKSTGNGIVFDRAGMMYAASSAARCRGPRPCPASRSRPASGTSGAWSCRGTG